MTNGPISPADPDVPYVVTYPAQDPTMIQPTFGRIYLAVLLANLTTGFVVGVVCLLVFGT